MLRLPQNELPLFFMSHNLSSLSLPLIVSFQMCVDQQHLSSTPQALLPPSTQALLTSTLLGLDKPVASASSSPLPEDTVSYSCHLDFSKVSSASLVSLSHSSPKSSVPSRKHNSSSAFMKKCFKSEV